MIASIANSMVDGAASPNFDCQFQLVGSDCLLTTAHQVPDEAESASKQW